LDASPEFSTEIEMSASGGERTLLEIEEAAVSEEIWFPEFAGAP